MRRRFDQAGLESVRIRNVFDRYAFEEIRKNVLRLLPDSLLGTYGAVRTVFVSLFDALHENQRPLDRLIDLFDADLRRRPGQSKSTFGADVRANQTAGNEIFHYLRQVKRRNILAFFYIGPAHHAV